MKIRIAIEKNENKDRAFLFNDYETIYVSEKIHKELDDRFDDAEAENIVIDGALDYVGVTLAGGIFNHAIKKLKINGSIVIIGIDSYAVSRDYTSLILNTQQFNEILFGGYKRSVMSVQDMRMNIEKVDELQLISVDNDGYSYMLEATRKVNNDG